MRLLLLLLAPVMGFSQLDTTVAYKIKHVHTIVIKPDSSTLSWKADTIKLSARYKIKFTATEIVIGRHGTYKIAKREMHGQIDSLPGWPYYELSNRSHLTWIENSIIWEWPIVKRKTKTIIFEVD